MKVVARSSLKMLPFLLLIYICLPKLVLLHQYFNCLQFLRLIIPNDNCQQTQSYSNSGGKNPDPGLHGVAGNL